MENKNKNTVMKSTEAGSTKMPSKGFVAIMEKLEAEYPGDFKAFIRGMLEAGDICGCRGMSTGPDKTGYITSNVRGVKNTA